MNHVVCKSKYVQKTGWQSGVWWCKMHGLPTHLVQELSFGTVDQFYFRPAFLIVVVASGKGAIYVLNNQAYIKGLVRPPQ